MSRDIASRAEEFRQSFTRLEDEISASVIGQRDVVRGLLTALFANGHVLLEGAPGLGKTLLVRTLGSVTGMAFSRAQFTPDLMPADIVGTNWIVEREGQKTFEFQPGPVFANILLADEINRATPKTQSALLEAMQERSVTIGGITRALPAPFFVLATQNPLEMEGTYPLPEAQLDRFLLKLIVDYPDAPTLRDILALTTAPVDTTPQSTLVSANTLLDFQQLVREVPVAPEILDRLVHLTLATHPRRTEGVPSARKFVRYGASPRGAQAVLLCAKISALLAGRYHVSRGDLRAMAAPALRHRLILNFEGEAEGITADSVIAEAVASAIDA